MDRSRLQFTIRNVILVTVGVSMAFAAGRVLGGPMMFLLVMLGLLGTLSVAACLFFLIADGQSVWSAMIVGVFLAAFVGRLIGWSPPHTASFAFAVALLVYFIAVWIGAEVPVQLDYPLIGIPLLLLFLLLVWVSHFGPAGHARPVTMTMTILTSAPFMASTFFNSIGLN